MVQRTYIQVKNEIHLPNNVNRFYIFFHSKVYTLYTMMIHTQRTVIYESGRTLSIF